MLERFSTADVRKAERFAYWHHFTCRTYSTTECRQLSDGPVNASVLFRRLDELLLSDVTEAPDWATRFWRGPQEIRLNPIEAFSLFAVQAGKVGIAQGENRTLVGPGEIALYDQARPFTLELPSGLRAMHVSIPRPLVTARVPAALELTARSLGNQLSRMAHEMVRQLMLVNVPANSAAAQRLCISTIELIAAALEWECLEKPAAAARQIEQIKHFMCANLHDAELDVETIANAHSISPRTLYRLFASEGSTPMRWLWKQRLDASYVALSQGHAARVTDVALSHGFNELSHFSRLFKNAFGRAPKSLKRTGAASVAS
jgi:AraC-like DNA-binding protein